MADDKPGAAPARRLPARRPSRPPRRDDADWGADWEGHRRHQLTFALEATPAERLAWLEEMIALAHRTGALPRRCAEDS